MGIGLVPSTAPTPPYRRMMAFIDGENLVFNYQASVKHPEVKPKSSVSFLENVFVWNPATINSSQHEIIRATYYTFAVGDDKKILEISSQIKLLTFDKDSRSRLPNNLHPRVFKKDKQGRRTKGVDIQMTVDILTHVFNDNVDTVFLVTGDGDFLPIINEIVRHGKQVVLAAFKNGLNPILLNSVDLFIDLDYIYFEQTGVHNLLGG